MTVFVVSVHCAVMSNVDHPQHYNAHPKGIECIDVIEEWPCFNIATACKYLWRCDHKGKDIEDLQKAVWYIEREIRRRQQLYGHDKQHGD